MRWVSKHLPWYIVRTLHKWWTTIDSSTLCLSILNSRWTEVTLISFFFTNIYFQCPTSNLVTFLNFQNPFIDLNNHHFSVSLVSFKEKKKLIQLLGWRRGNFEIQILKFLNFNFVNQCLSIKVLSFILKLHNIAWT